MRTHASQRGGPAALFVLVVSFAGAHFASPTEAPVDRLVQNAGAYVTEHPDDAYGQYVLARVHALAFTLETDTLSVWGEVRDRQGRMLPELASEDMQGWWDFGEASGDDNAPSRAELAAHLAPAVGGFERAIALDTGEETVEQQPDWGGLSREPGRALFHLGLAYVLERGAVLAADVDVLPSDGDTGPGAAEGTTPDPELEALIDRLGDDKASRREGAAGALRERLDAAAPQLFARRHDENAHTREAVRELLIAYWSEQAIRHYFVAFERASVDDVQIERKPLRGVQTLISYEAGTAYLALVRARGPRDEHEEERIERVAGVLATLAAKPNSGIITPIVLAIDGPKPLAELIDADARVCFDLDGDGRAELWPWLRPGTALLVWDPARTGRITSGVQLFGSVTWWMFPRDGYHALDLLDDDRDGQLVGGELTGLALWFDAGCDGVSGPGEVVPVADAGVLAIDTHALSEEDGCPANHTGVEFANGQVLPTYDWIAAPAEPDADPCGGTQAQQALADAVPGR